MEGATTADSSDMEGVAIADSADMARTARTVPRPFAEADAYSTPPGPIPMETGSRTTSNTTARERPSRVLPLSSNPPMRHQVTNRAEWTRRYDIRKIGPAVATIHPMLPSARSDRPERNTKKIVKASRHQMSDSRMAADENAIWDGRSATTRPALRAYPGRTSRRATTTVNTAARTP